MAGRNARFCVGAVSALPVSSRIMIRAFHRAMDLAIAAGNQV
jgi:hypothetical protein